jgi:rhamnulokinase
MELSTDKAALVAVDLGAQSCRVSLLRWVRGTPQKQIVHRFSNGPLTTERGLVWDLEKIVDGVIAGLQLCAEAANEGIASVGVDGWAVDYVRLRPDGSAVANPFCYRDARTRKAEKAVHALLSPETLYSLTGIQLLSINTLYQLYADKDAGMDPALPWLNIPEYIAHRLGGTPVSEYTNATHTQLVRKGSHEWCEEIFRATGLDIAAAPKIVPTGSVVGRLRHEMLKLDAFRNTQLIVPACHDTAAAIAAIPAVGDDWAFISSGTWSLVGMVLRRPCATPEAFRLNFTNLGGAGGSTCFLKNVNGMWLLQELAREWERSGCSWPLEELIRASCLLPAPTVLIDVDDALLMTPGNMLAKVNAQVIRAGHRAFVFHNADIPQIANTVFHSMAARYAEVLGDIATLSGKKLKRVFIVGGGSRNTLLNRLTAERSGLEVIPGATEASTIGNFAIQMAALDGDYEASIGVTGSSVANWAEALTAHSVTSSTESHRT